MIASTACSHLSLLVIDPERSWRISMSSGTSSPTTVLEMHSLSIPPVPPLPPVVGLMMPPPVPPSPPAAPPDPPGPAAPPPGPAELDEGPAVVGPSSEPSLAQLTRKSEGSTSAAAPATSERR
ncbi:MAG: hypothetical protein WKG00_09340 [Polyangiaceae bacterium]